MATLLKNLDFGGNNKASAGLKPSQREVEAIGQALKSPEFRAMLCDYVKEVQDPANQEQYIREMTQMEAAKGNQVDFFCVKIWDFPAQLLSILSNCQNSRKSLSK